MNSWSSLKLACLVVASFFVLTTSIAQPEMVISLDRKRDAVLDIEMPPSRAVYFVDSSDETHMQTRTSQWTQLSKCSVVHSNQMIQSSDCDRIRYKLTWDNELRDRRYPSMIRLSNGGALVFTAYIQLADEAGKRLPMRVLAPDGGVAVFRGKKSSQEIEILPAEISGDSRGWIYLGPDDFIDNMSIQILVDKGVPAKFGQTLQDALSDLLETYSTQLESKPKVRPAVYLVWSNRDQPGSSFQADTVPGGVIRFGLDGAGWRSPSPENLALLVKFAAHELAHLWNAEIYSVRGEDTPWLREGNAELLSVSALYVRSLIDADQALLSVNQALAQCAAAADGKSWKELAGARAQGRVPYACGMAIQFAIVAASQKSNAGDSAFRFWRDFWQEYPVYDESAVLRFVEKRVGGVFSASLRRLLNDDTWPIEDALDALLRPFGGVAENNFKWGKSAKRDLLKAFMMNLLIQNCSSRIGFSVNEQSIQIGSAMTCRNIEAGSRIVGFEGTNPLQNFEEAMSRARRACISTWQIRLQNDDGGTLVLPCNESILRSFPRVPNVTKVPSSIVKLVMAKYQ